MRIVDRAGCYDFPFDVKLNLDENIGGPSGGLMFAMGIYDVLTPGSLTGGKVIAGTGEIDAQGKVGEIGGIQQKLVGAQDDGAQLFLVPTANCAEALGGHYDPDKMRLVKVTTLDEAIKDVKAWVKDPNAKLPRCTQVSPIQRPGGGARRRRARGRGARRPRRLGPARAAVRPGGDRGPAPARAPPRRAPRASRRRTRR